MSLRTQHSLRLVHNDKHFTLEEVCDLKHSPLMLLAERVKGDLIAALRASGPTSELEAAIKVLENWDNTVAADSRGGTLFANWWERYSEKDKRPNKYATAWSAAEPTATPRGLADTPRAVATFIEALDEVNRLYGRPDVSWGEAHRIRKGNVDLPVSGGPGTMGCFRVLDFRTAADGKLSRQHGRQLGLRRRVQPAAQGLHGRGVQPERRRRLAPFQRSGGAVFGQQDEAGRLHRSRDQGPTAQDLSARAKNSTRDFCRCEHQARTALPR